MNVIRSFRLRVHNRGENNPSDLTVDFTLTVLAAPPTLPGPIVRPFEGRTETQGWSFDVIDDGAAITSRLATAGGRMHLLGRVVQVQMQEDGGAWETIGAARLANLAQAGDPGLYAVGLEDERWKERNTFVFTRADTTSLWPQGLRYPFRRFPAASTQACGVLEVRDNAVLLDTGIEHDPILPELEKLIAADLVDNPVVGTAVTVGNFRTLRANVAGTDREIISFETQYSSGAGLPIPGPGALQYEGKVTDSEGRLDPFWVVWPSGAGQPAVGTYVEVRLYAPEHEPDEAYPLHIGVGDASHDYGTAAGFIHPFDALERAYTKADIRFDPAAIAALKADPRYPLSAWRIRSKKKVAPWAEEAIYQPNIVVPFIDNEGRVSPQPLHLPAGVDPDTLFVFNASNTRAPHVTWHHGSRDALNVLDVQYTQEEWVPRVPGETDQGERKVPTDRIFVQERTLPPIQHDTVDDLGPKPMSVRLDGLHRGMGRDIGGIFDPLVMMADRLVRHQAERIATDLFEVAGDGPQAGTIHGMLSTSGVKAGDLVVLDQDSLKNPNPAANARSGQRIVRILQRTFRVDGYEFEYLDAGAKLQPLSAPVISIAQNASDPQSAVDITVSGLAAGTKANVYVALNSGLTELEELLVELGNETVTVRNLPATTTIYAAGYAHAPGRIQSVLSAVVSVVTDAAAPTVRSLSLILNEDGSVTVIWAVNATVLGVRLYFGGHAKDAVPALVDYVDVNAAAGEYTFTADQVSGGAVFTVEAEGWTGWASPDVTGAPGSRRRRSVQLPDTAPRVTYFDLEKQTDGTVLATVEVANAAGVRLYFGSHRAKVDPELPEYVDVEVAAGIALYEFSAAEIGTGEKFTVDAEAWSRFVYPDRWTLGAVTHSRASTATYVDDVIHRPLGAVTFARASTATYTEDA